MNINNPKFENTNDSSENSFRVYRQTETVINIDEHLAPIRSQLKTIETRFDNKLSRINDNIEAFFQTLNDQILNVKNKQEEDFQKVRYDINGFQSEVNEVNATNERIITYYNHITEVVSLFIECFKIQQILDISDEQDREKMGLYGIKESLIGD